MKMLISAFFVIATLASGFALADATVPAEPVAATTAQVNINTADAKTLSEQLEGIGEVKAQAIVDFREANGPFVSAADLGKVTGIGARTLEQNRKLITVQ
ncbi:ComEA family DNA-binding protein [Marinobacter fonticola]|uniref:ComEA family DNA-binding protein n=1 Tax=Marinobacter fonticola TaxID=2603215 RepID=UPI0011E68BAB|nr:ComEA family DNA-binding protein [Marinobacter fonticola]